MADSHMSLALRGLVDVKLRVVCVCGKHGHKPVELRIEACTL